MLQPWDWPQERAVEVLPRFQPFLPFWSFFFQVPGFGREIPIDGAYVIGCSLALREPPGQRGEICDGSFRIYTFAPEDRGTIPQKETKVLWGKGMKACQPPNRQRPLYGHSKRPGERHQAPCASLGQCTSKERINTKAAGDQGLNSSWSRCLWPQI